METTQDRQSTMRLFKLKPFFVNLALGAMVSLVTVVTTGIAGLVAGKTGGLLGMAGGLAGSGWGLSGIASVRRNFRIIPFALGFVLGTTGLIQLGEHVGARKQHAPVAASQTVAIPYAPLRPVAVPQYRTGCAALTA